MSSLGKFVDRKKKSINMHYMYFPTPLIYSFSMQKANVYSNRNWELSATWIICNSHNDSFDSVVSILPDFSKMEF